MSKLGQYYKDFGITPVTDHDLLQKQKLYNLYKKPIKDKGVNMPHIDVREPNITHQADLLFLPNDNGYRYALVVVDCNNGLTDAVPLKSKESKDVLAGFKKIYQRGPLKIPQNLQVDSGAEFKGDVKKYFDDKHVYVRAGLPGRHRMQALAERRNQTIGTALLMRMTSQELLTGSVSNEWVDDLPVVIDAINKQVKLKPKKKYPDVPVCKGDSCNLLKVGTIVRVILDEPRDLVTMQRLPGKFRSGDIRFDPKPRIIKQVLLKPGQPPTYLVDGDVGPNKIRPVAYTKNQLQVVPEDEQYPDTKVIRGKPTTYVVEKILDKRKHKNRIEFLVKWAGYPHEQNTWEPRTQLIEDVPGLVLAFERSLK
jgi:hypothetical protein